MLWTEPGCPAALLAGFGFMAASAQIAQGGQEFKEGLLGSAGQDRVLKEAVETGPGSGCNGSLLSPLFQVLLRDQERTGCSGSGEGACCPALLTTHPAQGSF